jgi:hypothetical protein
MSVIETFRKLVPDSVEVYRHERETQRERLMHNEQLKNGIERVVLFRNRVRSRARARKREKVRIQALASVRQTLEHAVKTKAKNI